MSNTLRTTLPPAGVHLLTALADEQRTTFSTADALRLCGRSAGATYTLLSRLVSGGWLARLERGRYLIVPLEAGREARWTEEPFVLATQLASPSAISHWSAASFWNLTEQLVTTVFVSTPQRKFRTQQTIAGVPVRFIHRPERKFFGAVQQRVGDRRISIMSVEKTLVDVLEQPQYAGGIVEAAKAFKNAFDERRVDVEAFAQALGRIGNGAVAKRAGFLLELFRLHPELQAQLERELTAGETLLNPLAERQGPRSARWRLRVNVSTGDLVDWQDY